MWMHTERTTRAGRPTAILFAVVMALLSYRAAATEVAVLRNGFTIRHEHRRAIGDNTRLFLDEGTASFIDVPTADIEGYEKELAPPPEVAAPAPPPPTVTAAPKALSPALDLNQVVNSASAAYHLDPDLVNSVIHAESGFNSHAVSRKGAQGLMQLMPDTASSWASLMLSIRNRTSLAAAATCANCWSATTSTWSKRWPRITRERSGSSNTRECRPTVKPTTTWPESCANTIGKRSRKKSRRPRNAGKRRAPSSPPPAHLHRSHRVDPS